MIDRSVLTIATGKPIYIQMAINLARSFKLWHKDSSIQFFLATDQKNLIPTDLSDIGIIELQPEQYGKGFSPKLFLDELAPANKNIFIDADCLCYGSLESVFDGFDGKSVAVIGDAISQGEFFCDVAEICKRFQIDVLPRFVGGLYYFEKGETSKKVFETARSLEKEYDKIGLIRLRGHANEEPLIAIAMALNGQSSIVDDGSIKAERMSYDYKMLSDLFGGIAKLYNKSDSFPTWVRLREADPIIVHFNAHYVTCEPYTSEVIRLEKVISDQWTILVASVYVLIFYSLPANIIRFSKHTLRPIFRKMFGARKVMEGVR